MIHIGDKQLVFSETFLLSDDEVALFEVQVSSTNTVKVSLLFSPEPSESMARWNLEDDILKLSFQGWRSPLGMCTQQPVRLGDVDGESLGFAVAQRLVGQKINLVTLQIYRGGSYGQ